MLGKQLVKIQRAVWKNCPLRRVLRIPTQCSVHSVRAPKGFSEGKPEASKPRGRSPRGFEAKGLPEENPEVALTLPAAQCGHPRHSP